MTDLKNFLQGFLDSIDYPDSKEDFIEKLLSSIYLRTIEELLVSMPKEKQDLLKGQLKDPASAESLKVLVDKSFDKQAFESALKSNSEKIFKDYIDTITPVLTDELKDKMQKYLSSQNPIG